MANNSISLSGAHIIDSQGNPIIGEITGSQGTLGHFGFGGGTPIPKPPQLLWDYYDEIEKDANVALAQEIAKAPIRSAEHTVETDEDVTNDEIAPFVDSQFKRVKTDIMKSCLEAVMKGYTPNEIVYKIDDGRIVIERVKQLSKKMTQVVTEKETGRLAGLKNKKETILFPNCFIYTHDIRDENYYGRGRFENIRRAYRNVLRADTRSADYMDKVCPVIPMVQYPQGRSIDATGREVDNYEIAMATVRDLCRSKGVVMPNTLVKVIKEMISAGVRFDADMMKPWSLDILQTTGRHGGEIVELKNMHVRDIYRGLYVLERIATEGVHGTKAESGEHASIYRLIADHVLSEIYACIQAQIIDPLVRFNFGIEFVGRVRIQPQSLVDNTRQLIEAILRDLFGKNYDAVLANLDLGKMMDKAGLPKREDLVNPEQQRDLNANDD